MRIFDLDAEFSVVCNWCKTRNGFKHVATLMQNGLERAEVKECYLNRTWERFEYETVLLKVVNQYFDKGQADEYRKVVASFK